MDKASTTAMRPGLSVALSSGLLALLASCSAPAARPPAQVQAIRLHEAVFVRSLETVSSLEASNEIELASQAGGRVQRVLVQAGDTVRAGQVLVVLDQTQLRADVAALRATAETDALAYQRYQSLVSEGAATALQRDEYRAKAIGSRQALLAKQADLAYKDVRAPISGVMDDISIKPGDVVQAGTPFSRIIRNDRLEARIDVPANQANAVSRGQRVQLLDGINPKPVAEGRIARIDPGVKGASQTLLAKAPIANNAGLLRDGQRLSTRVILGAERHLAVPYAAVTRSFGQSFVFVVGSVEALKRDPGQADLQTLQQQPKGTLVALQRPVELGPLQGDVYPLVRGITPQDQVILSGGVGLRHGSPIRLAHSRRGAPRR